MIPYALENYLNSPEFQSLVDDAQATYVVEHLKEALDKILGSRSGFLLENVTVKWNSPHNLI